jgi:drug/metabolite transporter (DMT)-like permease
MAKNIETRAALRFYALSLLVATGVLFGLVVSLTRLATTGGVPFLAFAFWEILGATVCVLAYCALRRRMPRFDRRHLPAYLGMAVVGGMIPPVVFALVAPKLPVGIVSLTVSLSPVMTLLIALGLRMERFNLWRLAGIALGIVGVLLILLPETSLPEPGMAVWVVVALAAPMGLGLGNIGAVRLRPADNTATQFAAGILCLASLLLLPLMIAVHGAWAFDGPLDTGQIALLAAMPIMALVWCFAMEIARVADAVFLSLFDYLSTLAGIGWGIAIFAEHHSPWVWGALALLMASIWLVTRTAHVVTHRSES